MLRNFDNRLNADVIQCLRAMGHGDPSLAIGARVRLAFRDVAGRPVPYFEPHPGLAEDPAR